MKFEEFKSGKYSQQYQYKSFLPAKINHEWTRDDPRLVVQIGGDSDNPMEIARGQWRGNRL